MKKTNEKLEKRIKELEDKVEWYKVNTMTEDEMLELLEEVKKEMLSEKSVNELAEKIKPFFEVYAKQELSRIRMEIGKMWDAETEENENYYIALYDVLKIIDKETKP